MLLCLKVTVVDSKLIVPRTETDESILGMMRLLTIYDRLLGSSTETGSTAADSLNRVDVIALHDFEAVNDGGETSFLSSVYLKSHADPLKN